MQLDMATNFPEDFSAVQRHHKCSDDMLWDQLTLFYVEAVQQLLFAVSRIMCYGCREGHLSQTRHNCITLTAQQKLHRCFFPQYIEKKMDTVEMIISVVSRLQLTLNFINHSLERLNREKARLEMCIAKK